MTKSEDRNITIQTTRGQIEINEDFNIENNQPFPGMVKITDRKNDEIYWLNPNELVWIGPRWKGPVE